MRERRDDLRDVLLAHWRAERTHYPDLADDAQYEQRILTWHASATKKNNWLLGMEEAVRDTRHCIEAWSSEARATFLAQVLATTGQSFFAISPHASKEVARLVQRKKRTYREHELRTLIDYVSDYPDGELAKAATQVFREVRA